MTEIEIDAAVDAYREAAATRRLARHALIVAIAALAVCVVRLFV